MHLSQDLWSLLLVMAGGVIGLAGSIVTALVSHRIEWKRQNREALQAAYADWSKALFRAIREGEQMWLYDVVEDLKRSRLDLTAPSSTTGRTREQHAADYQKSIDELRACEARVLLLERIPVFRKRLSEISTINPPLVRNSPTDPGHMGIPEVLAFSSEKTKKLYTFLGELSDTHPHLLHS